MLFKLIIPVIIIAAMPMVIRLLFIYSQYSSSSYKEASGHTYFQTAFNTGNYGEFLTFRKLEKLPGHKKSLQTFMCLKRMGIQLKSMS